MLVPIAYILIMLIHIRHGCPYMTLVCLDHTSHKWRHDSAHRIHFNYAHTFKTWLSLYDTRFLSIPHTCDVICMAFHITVQVLTHVTSPFYHSCMASGSYEYPRSTLYHVWFLSVIYHIRYFCLKHTSPIHLQVSSEIIFNRLWLFNCLYIAFYLTACVYRMWRLLFY